MYECLLALTLTICAALFRFHFVPWQITHFSIFKMSLVESWQIEHICTWFIPLCYFHYCFIITDALYYNNLTLTCSPWIRRLYATVQPLGFYNNRVYCVWLLPIILMIFTLYKYMVYSYSEKPSYSYKCSTRGFENIDFLILFFGYYEPTNARLTIYFTAPYCTAATCFDTIV